MVSKRDDFVVNALLYFKPVQRFEFRSDMFNFGGSNLLRSQVSFAIAGD